LLIALVFVVAPARARRQNNLVASSWLHWQQSLERSANHCRKFSRCLNDSACREDNRRLRESLDVDSSCLSERLKSVLQERPRLKQETDLTGFVGDLIAGQLMLANDNTRAVLNSRLSTGNRFLGAGLAEPARQTEITA